MEKLRRVLSGQDDEEQGLTAQVASAPGRGEEGEGGVGRPCWPGPPGPARSAVRACRAREPGGGRVPTSGVVCRGLRSSEGLLKDERPCVCTVPGRLGEPGKRGFPELRGAVGLRGRARAGAASAPRAELRGRLPLGPSAGLLGALGSLSRLFSASRGQGSGPARKPTETVQPLPSVTLKRTAGARR